MVTAVGYCRVSTTEQGESGAGLDAQEAAIRSEVERRGWTLSEVFVDVASGKSTRRRPRLGAATQRLSAGTADVLIVAKLDRLSRSMLDFAGFVDQAAREQWSIVALDIGVDTSTTNGRMLANIIMALAQWERELIGDRTRAALGAVKARGVTLGRPVSMDPGTVTLMRLLRSNGRSYGAIAKMLNNEGVPTAQGGVRWYASTVRAALARGK